MSKRHLLVGGGVGLICAAILVLFTDIEVTVVKWVNCGPLSLQQERASRLCR